RKFVFAEKDWVSAGAFLRTSLHRDDHLSRTNPGISQRSDASSDALAQLSHRHRARSDNVVKRDVKQTRSLVRNEGCSGLILRARFRHVDPRIVRSGVASSA